MTAAEQRDTEPRATEAVPTEAGAAPRAGRLTVRANGIDVAYEVVGAGPPLVMLHGAGSTARVNWSAQIPLFGRAFRLFLPDARGHGATRWDAAGGFDTELLVGDLEGFADAIGLDTFHLIGFSMGAMTALTFATRHPDRLRTLVLGGIDTEREPRTSVARHLMDPARIDRDDPSWAADLERRHGPVQGAGAWRRLLPAIARDVAAQPLLSPRDLRRVDMPAMVVIGDRDQFVPVEHAQALRRQLPDARLFVVPDCHHEVMSCRAGLFNEGCASFYRSTESAARARVRRPGFRTHPHREGSDTDWFEQDPATPGREGGGKSV